MRHSIGLTALALVLAVGHALGAERRYDVEIVIIENTNTGAGEHERWRPEVIVAEITGSIVPPSASQPAPMARRERMAETPAGFEPLPPEQTTLGGAIERLEQSEAFRVLRHLAWRQPALDQDQALPVRAHYGDPVSVRVPITDFNDLYALERSAAEGTGADAAGIAAIASDQGSAQTFSTGPMFQSNRRALLKPVEVHPLDGTIRVVVSRYLHVYTDLYFTAPVEWTAFPVTSHATDSNAVEAGDGEAARPVLRAPTVALGPDGQAMLSYPFVQHRRMRSGELHYLDHPVLGMLIRVDRAPETAEPAAAQAAEGA